MPVGAPLSKRSCKPPDGAGCGFAAGREHGALVLPELTHATAALTCQINAVNEYGEVHPVAIPAERALTVYVDKRELVTLMTLGAQPELLVLGYLRNQRLVACAAEVESITVDWEVGAAAVKTRHGIAHLAQKTAKRVVTTGCGQGSVFGALMDDVDRIVLPPDAQLSQRQLYALVNAIRLKETTYKSAGSVHACALFSVAAEFDASDAAPADPEMLLFVEDVGRHNAIDTIAGWLAMNPAAGADAQGFVFYTTGRLTSEMVIKSAQMNVPIVVSRSGITQMAHQVAELVGLCAIGRATHKRFVCYSQAQRLRLSPGLAGPKPAAYTPAVQR